MSTSASSSFNTTPLSSLLRRIRILEDREFVRDLLYSYCNAVDSHRFADSASHFTENGKLHFGAWKLVVGREAIVMPSVTADSKFEWLVHSLSNLHVRGLDVNGENGAAPSTASATAYVAFIATPELAEPHVCYPFGGAYEFELVKMEEEGWRVRKVRVSQRWETGEDPTGTSGRRS
ncbi:hypothetical protein JCM8097_000249 [Rhodosporidiobolus ruineniae]